MSMLADYYQQHYHSPAVLAKIAEDLRLVGDWCSMEKLLSGKNNSGLYRSKSVDCSLQKIGVEEEDKNLGLPRPLHEFDTKSSPCLIDNSQQCIKKDYSIKRKVGITGKLAKLFRSKTQINGRTSVRKCLSEDLTTVPLPKLINNSLLMLQENVESSENPLTVSQETMGPIEVVVVGFNIFFHAQQSFYFSFDISCQQSCESCNHSGS